MAELLPQLHEYAVETARARCSVLLQISPRTGGFHPTSAFGLDDLPTAPWLTGNLSQLARTTMSDGAPAALRDLPAQYVDLAERLHTRHAILLPLIGLESQLGVLVLGTDEDPAISDIAVPLGPVADAFILTMERLRLQRDADLQRDLRALMLDFSDQVSATLTLRAGLEIFCDGASRLFGADSTQVWLHNRETRELTLEACSENALPPESARVPTSRTEHPASGAMRAAGPQVYVGEGRGIGTPTIAVGLKGRRRALGTLLFDVMRLEPAEEADVLARVDEVGRQLAAAIENTQLLQQVLQSRR